MADTGCSNTSTFGYAAVPAKLFRASNPLGAALSISAG
jgi:hypothetical protein